MDTQYLGGGLIGRKEIEADRRGLSTEAGEDAYYGRHAPKPAGGRVLRIASAIAAAWFGFAAVGLRLQ